MSRTSPQPTGLTTLEARLQQDLSWLEWPAKAWVQARTCAGRPVRDVVILGGGMCGLVAAAALKGLGVANLVVYDRAPAGQEGPWVTFARMETLRSPKTLTGPALGLPALTFRAWYEAQYGVAAWEQLGKIPRPMWMDYLTWYRKVLDLPVENEVLVTAIRPGPDGLIEAAIERGGQAEVILTRHLVLATGRDGLGGPYVPEMARSVDRRFWAHTSDDIDFAALRGKRVGVIGAGASAIDNAATALEAGAASLDLFIRRTDIPRINKFTGIGSQGVIHGFEGLPDEWKWRFLDYTLSEQTPPPRDSTLRVSRNDNARFHLGSPITSLVQEGDALLLSTPKGRYELDFLIFGTGFAIDLNRRPELASIAPFIRFWGDRFTPPAGQENEELSSSPDLGPAFAFQEKVPGTCPILSRIHGFNFPATLSHGKLSGDIPAVSEGGARLARGIVRDLFVADAEKHFAGLVAYDTAELQGDEWHDHDAPAPAEASNLHSRRLRPGPIHGKNVSPP